MRTLLDRANYNQPLVTLLLLRLPKADKGKNAESGKVCTLQNGQNNSLTTIQQYWTIITGDQIDVAVFPDMCFIVCVMRSAYMVIPILTISWAKGSKHYFMKALNKAQA